MNDDLQTPATQAGSTPPPPAAADGSGFETATPAGGAPAQPPAPVRARPQNPGGYTRPTGHARRVSRPIPPSRGARGGYAARRGSASGGKAEQPGRKKGRVRRFFLKTLSVLMIFVISVVGLIFGVITIICKGPFPNARDLFVVSVEETSAIKFMSRIYYSEDEVQAILAANKVIEMDDVTDVTKPFDPPPATGDTEEDIEIHEVSGDTFVGKMMIVKDPSRVELACLDAFGGGIRGKQVETFATENGATAAINSGFFDDPGGVGKGGQPLGLLICDGVIRNGSTGMVSTIIGFDTDNHLIVGKMSGQEALDMNVRDAVTVEPTIMPPLIINGNLAEFTGNGSGLNPRTALGQRADGAVLMLVIDGRQPHSLGATIQDCQKLMLEFGAINAAMQDGGSSSVMWYEGETINVCSSLYGSRAQPSAWLVM